MRRLDRLQLLEQRVVVGVGDLGRVEHVVGVGVVRELRAQRRGARGRIGAALRRAQAPASARVTSPAGRSLQPLAFWPRPERREIAAAARLGGGAQRPDRRRGERKRRRRRVVDLADQSIDDAARRPAGDEPRQRGVARRLAHQRLAMDAAGRRFGAAEIGGADLDHRRAERERGRRRRRDRRCRRRRSPARAPRRRSAAGARRCRSAGSGRRPGNGRDGRRPRAPARSPRRRRAPRASAPRRPSSRSRGCARRWRERASSSSALGQAEVEADDRRPELLDHRGARGVERDAAGAGRNGARCRGRVRGSTARARCARPPRAQGRASGGRWQKKLRLNGALVAARIAAISRRIAAASSIAQGSEPRPPAAADRDRQRAALHAGHRRLDHRQLDDRGRDAAPSGPRSAEQAARRRRAGGEVARLERRVELAELGADRREAGRRSAAGRRRRRSRRPCRRRAPAPPPARP